MAVIRVRYKGFYCFGETAGTPFSAGSDSPYILFGGVHVPPNDQTSAITTEIYNDINSGSSQTGDLELYRGIPGGMALGISLFVHHSGNPNQYLDLVKEGVVLAGKGVSQGCGALLGEDAVPACQSIWATVSPAIVKFVNGLIPAGDTLIRNSTMTITHKDMVTLADTPRQNFWGIEYHLESELLSDGDASYKVYFDIERV